jgi:hypothetical protein
MYMPTTFAFALHGEILPLEIVNGDAIASNSIIADLSGPGEVKPLPVGATPLYVIPRADLLDAVERLELRSPIDQRLETCLSICCLQVA